MQQSLGGYHEERRYQETRNGPSAYTCSPTLEKVVAFQNRPRHYEIKDHQLPLYQNSSLAPPLQ